MEYLISKTETKPEQVFLDIYMPVMNGWEFLDEYCMMDKEDRCNTVIVMLATTGDPEHTEGLSDSISSCMIKPLTEEKVKEIGGTYLRLHPVA